VPAVLGAVAQYWQDHPATEAEVEAMAQPAAEQEPASPPRQRSGHWVH
jgi:uncharacterized protein